MRVFAPAKINLALHVTGRRTDGYHLLDSLVVFADVGDWLDVESAPEFRLSVTGPRAEGVPVDPGNLIWRAVDSLGETGGVAITLEKHLPMAGGIGGGSSDAAAALRAVTALRSQAMPDTPSLLALGADMPVCAAAETARMRGIGEVLSPVPPLPPLWLVLVNPGVAVPTGSVFGALATADNPAMPDPAWSDARSFFDWLTTTRNDLEPVALRQVPAVAEVLSALAHHPDCRMARMSGSGGTCFGIFGAPEAAENAAERLRRDRPDWWVASCRVLDAPP